MRQCAGPRSHARILARETPAFRQAPSDPSREGDWKVTQAFPARGENGQPALDDKLFGLANIGRGVVLGGSAGPTCGRCQSRPLPSTPSPSTPHTLFPTPSSLHPSNPHTHTVGDHCRTRWKKGKRGGHWTAPAFCQRAVTQGGVGPGGRRFRQQPNFVALRDASIASKSNCTKLSMSVAFNWLTLVINTISGYYTATCFSSQRTNGYNSGPTDQHVRVCQGSRSRAFSRPQRRKEAGGCRRR